MHLPSPAFWKGKRVLLTGHTGFKGSWLALWLNHLGAHVTGVALPPNSTPSLFELTNLGTRIESHYCNIRQAEPLAALIRQSAPEIVFHLAAQALVRASYADPLGTYGSNVMGTAHVLNALRDLGTVRVAVMVTTDKVYQPKENIYPYRETDALGGHDPYSASKAASEIIIDSYRRAFLSSQGVSVASARAGNVIGGGDWSADRLIPDAIRAWQGNTPLQIRQPESIRPWQHVLEPLQGYLSLAQHLWQGSAPPTAYNFGPLPHEAASVRKIINMARAAYGSGSTQWDTPANDTRHEASWLALETAFARQTLGVTPKWALEEVVSRTLLWYRGQNEGQNAYDLCLADLEAYSTHC
ncbi:CDP-glucose 4,6-dehydratase [Pollutimonas sp. M17]|uniref:CDP-glucose 4,6-dehydratase n=1 Tax=Pollutimonas sp. M17 TaxID=2962065 RepID=UPI0021F4862F|nr:CDP-glucose 4,6-dehydratase [Pollutimonas sp. M17]UYO94999.1 CDP-glucose 4,6-dehydratase [Pollutimonas sp. M17]